MFGHIKAAYAASLSCHGDVSVTLVQTFLYDMRFLGNATPQNPGMVHMLP